MGSEAKNLGGKTIDDLPDEVLEYILSLVSPYKDSDSCKLVSKRWCRTINSVTHHSKGDLYRSVLNSSVLWHCLVSTNSKITVITQRYSHAACYCDSFMYVFGGCTSRFTTFNDLWTLDLSDRYWIRLFTTGSYPSPKACATLCCYNKNLVLFGGWTYPPAYPLHQTLKLFNELHIYSTASHKWTIIHSTVTPPPMAGHSATIHGNLMVVFGGYHRDDTMFHRSSNHVWCYNLETECWSQPETSNPKPKTRYGQSQIFLDDHNILIMGGCEGPNSILDDVWLLTITSTTWIWKQLKVNNPQWAAPHLWCHPACKVGDLVVVFSHGTSQINMSHHSMCSSFDGDDLSAEDRAIPPEVVARVSSQSHTSYDRDVNVNGQRGSLGKIKTFDEPSTSSLCDSDRTTPLKPNQHSNKNKVIQDHQEPESYSGGIRVGSDIQMAAFQSSSGVAPKSGNRLKQLECLKRMEAKFKKSQGGSQERNEVSRRKPIRSNDSSDPDPNSPASNNSNNKMNMYVLDISQALKENACVSWRPQRRNSNAPREKMLHSLVLGKGELIIFGGVLKNPSVPSYKYVSNSTHIIKAPRSVI